MSTSVQISPATFAQAYRRFERQVENDSRGYGPFTSFQSGLAHSMEHYKEWLCLEAQRRLGVDAWRKNWIGSGQIVRSVVAAIEIYEDKNHRNNLVEWQGKKGPSSRSHQKLLAARDDRSHWLKAEKVFWDMYAEEEDPEICFEHLAELFGGRYDLISYLFFIRDWNEFMPLKSTFFPEVFELLGVPHLMVRQCNWPNYAGVLARLREVQRHLQGYPISDGVRLIDAHSFCWMLSCLEVPEEPEGVVAKIIGWMPEAGDAPVRGIGSSYHLKELEENQISQKRIGDLAQSIVLEAERCRLREAGRVDLATQVKDVSENVALGYDIASFTEDGSLKPIEVKAAARRGEDCRFFLSENERLKACDLPNYHFVLVFDLESNNPILREFSGQHLPPISLYPSQYEVRLRYAMNCQAEQSGPLL